MKAQDTRRALYSKVRTFRAELLRTWDLTMRYPDKEYREDYEKACRAYNNLMHGAVLQAHYRCQAGAWRAGEKLAPERRTPEHKLRIGRWIEAILRLGKLHYPTSYLSDGE